MEKTDNPYTTLGLSIDADETAIKKAYFQLAKKWHPDKQKTDADREAATKVFAKIADAYALLQDPVRRYDWRQANESSSRSSPPSRTSSERTRPMRSPSPKSTKSNSTTSLSATKRTNSNRSSSAMPKSKKAYVQPNIIRMSPEQDRKSSARPSVRGPSARRQSVPRRSARRTSARTSRGARSPVRSSERPSVPNSPRSPIRQCGRATSRTSGGKTPVCYSGGKFPRRASTASITVRRSHHAPLMASPPGRRKKTPTSGVGRKPRKNGLESHSDHVPRSKVTRGSWRELNLKLQ